MPDQIATELYAHNARLAEALEAHDRLDTERFLSVEKTLTKIDTNVESLLLTRSFFRGALWSVGAISAVVSGFVSLLITYLITYLKH